MSRERQLPGVSAALIEMLEASGELDDIISGRGLRFDNPPAPVVPPPQPFHPPAPDWDEEERLRLAAEQEQQRQERAKILDEELARIAAEDEHTYPKPPAKKRKWRA